MAGQAGWYHAPGESGVLRYWNGSTWTDHRQPVPVAVSPVPPPAAPPRAPIVIGPIVVGPIVVGPVAMGPIAVEPIADASIAGAEAAVTPLPAEGIARVAPDRRKILGALAGMGAALLIVVLSLGALALFSARNNAGAGEMSTSGIVVNVGLTSDNSCVPIARFAVRGRSYTANSPVAMSPCSVGLGEMVDVSYAASDPAAAARIELGSPVTQYGWLVPVLSGVFFLGSLATFIVRAGSIARGIAVVRDGGQRDPKRAAAA